MNRFVAAAIGGLLATAPMTAFMAAAFKKLRPTEQYPLPPREITEEIVAKIQSGKNAEGAVKLKDKDFKILSLIAHYGYGATAGAAYPLVLRSPRQRILTGAIFGIAMWAAAYIGWVPAAKILTPATRHPIARNALMLGAHVVWGVSSVLLGEMLKQNPRSRRL